MPKNHLKHVTKMYTSSREATKVLYKITYAGCCFSIVFAFVMCVAILINILLQ